MPYDPRDREHTDPVTERQFDGPEVPVLSLAEEFREEFRDVEEAYRPDRPSGVLYNCRLQEATYRYAEDLVDGTVQMDPARVVETMDLEDLSYVNYDRFGTFISALYNNHADDTFVYDVEPNGADRLSHIGYRLPADRELVLETDALEDAGQMADGWMVNRGDLQHFYRGGSGVAVNDGDTHTLAASLQEDGIAVNLDNAGQMGRGSAGVTVNYGSVGSFHERGTGIAINFGQVETFGENCRGICINYGHVEDWADSSERDGTEHGAFLTLTDTADALEADGRKYAVGPEEIEKRPSLAYTLQELEEQIGPDRSVEEVTAYLQGLDPDPAFSIRETLLYELVPYTKL